MKDSNLRPLGLRVGRRRFGQVRAGWLFAIHLGLRPAVRPAALQPPRRCFPIELRRTASGTTSRASVASVLGACRPCLLDPIPKLVLAQPAVECPAADADRTCSDRDRDASGEQDDEIIRDRLRELRRATRHRRILSISLSQTLFLPAEEQLSTVPEALRGPTPPSRIRSRRDMLMEQPPAHGRTRVHRRSRRCDRAVRRRAGRASRSSSRRRPDRAPRTAPEAPARGRARAASPASRIARHLRVSPAAQPDIGVADRVVDQRRRQIRHDRDDFVPVA